MPQFPSLQVLRIAVLFFLAVGAAAPAMAEKPVLCPAPKECKFRTPDGHSADDFDKKNHRNITPPKGSNPGPNYEVFDCIDDKCKTDGCHCFILKERQTKGVTDVSQLYDGDSASNKHKLTVKEVETDEKETKGNKNVTYKYSAVCASNDKSKIWGE
jgi:hypothetical protein